MGSHSRVATVGSSLMRWCDISVGVSSGFTTRQVLNTTASRSSRPPTTQTAAAIEIADVALGHLRSNRLLRVLSAEEMHTALRQAATAPNIAPKPAA